MNNNILKHKIIMELEINNNSYLVYAIEKENEKDKCLIHVLKTIKFNNQKNMIPIEDKIEKDKVFKIIDGLLTISDSNELEKYIKTNKVLLRKGDANNGTK